MRKKYFTRVSVLLVVLFGGIILMRLIMHTLHLNTEESSLIADIGQMVVEAVAAIMVVIQLEQEGEAEIKEANIKEAEFLLQYNQAFIQDPNMTEVEHLLEIELEGGSKIQLTSDNRQKFINYLVYLEGLAPLILHDILQLEVIDDLMAYRFFLAVNNKTLQEDQLFPYAEYYRGCFKLYSVWKEYRSKRQREIVWNENSLDNWEGFHIYAE